MRPVSFILVLLCLLPGIAHAETPSPSLSCGATASSALAAAQEANKENNPASDHAALACLIEAVEKLNVPFATRSDGNSVLHFPVSDAKVQPK